ncbi:MAG: tetratricopeptide repeat protein, partial [Deltaproteobacteria bacterium]
VEEKVQGSEAVPVTSALDALGALYVDEGEYEKAEPLYRRKLDIEEKHFGKFSPALLGSLQQIASVLRKMGRESEAIQFDQRREAILKSQSSPRQ